MVFPRLTSICHISRPLWNEREPNLNQRWTQPIWWQTAGKMSSKTTPFAASEVGRRCRVESLRDALAGQVAMNAISFPVLALPWRETRLNACASAETWKFLPLASVGCDRRSVETTTAWFNFDTAIEHASHNTRHDHYYHLWQSLISRSPTTESSLSSLSG